MNALKVLREKRGQVGPLAMVIPLVLVFGLAIIIASLMATIGGKTYASVQSDLMIDGNADNVSGTAIETDINASVQNAFESYNQATQNLDLLAIIAVAFVVISAVMLFMQFGRGQDAMPGAL